MTHRSLACLLALGCAVAPGVFADQHPDQQAGQQAGLPHAFDAGWQGQQTCELLYDTPQVQVGRCSFAPGVGHEPHYHNPHFGYVLAGGTLRIKSAKGETVVTTVAGDTWTTDARTVHQAVNIGDTTTSYLIVEPKEAMP